MITPKDFFNLAVELKEGTDEVVIRTSINRSYYYVYHYIMMRCKQRIIHLKERGYKVSTHRISEVL